MATAVLAMSVHPLISPESVDDHTYEASDVDLAGLAAAIHKICKDGNEQATVRIANTYLDLDAIDDLKLRPDNLSKVERLGQVLMSRASMPGKSRKGVISVTDEWSMHLSNAFKETLLAPSVFFIIVKASTSLRVGDWLFQALALFDSYAFPADIAEAFAGGCKKSKRSPGRLPAEISEKLESMFGLEFSGVARLEIVCRKD